MGIQESFLRFAVSKPEWADVVSIINATMKRKVEETRVIIETTKKVSYFQFMPPIIADLSKLGQNEGKSSEFEEKTHLAFKMLGFKVVRFGQGTGRNPEGIAYALQHRYAILYDAKSRKDRYSLGTDDRAFKDYINKYKNQLIKDGYNKIYFLVISHKFAQPSHKALAKFFKETHVPFVFVSTDQMLRLVSKKIEKPLSFDLGDLEMLFVVSGPIDNKKFEEYLVNIDKKYIKQKTDRL